jgi:hypothetical protein
MLSPRNKRELPIALASLFVPLAAIAIGAVTLRPLATRGPRPAPRNAVDADPGAAPTPAR